MRKSQALILQFIIFFVIGLTFFLLVGNLFRFQSDIIKKDVLDLNSELINRYMSALTISSVDTCKSCETTSIKTNIKNIVGYNPEFTFNSNGITLSIEPEKKTIQSTIHNLYNSIIIESNKVSSDKPISLMYDRTKNNLVSK